MPDYRTIFVWAAFAIGLAIIVTMVRGSIIRQRTRERLFRTEPEREAPAARASDDSALSKRSWLANWLEVSGFHSANAVTSFLIVQGLGIVVGGLLTFLVLRSGFHELGVEWLLEIPGGVGDFLAPILKAAPWLIFLIAALLPVSHVRGRRRQIVEQVERDLPMMLVLLSTLVESGLGFDAAVQRVLQSTDSERYLADGLRTFRSENRAGIPRVACFRRFAQRLDVGSVSTFVSAMVHAEHVGGGIAESLRRQADEVWSRRRELAIQRAQTLPTRLAVPLVTCFLPGIFVYTFGPALAEFIRIAENVVN